MKRMMVAVAAVLVVAAPALAAIGERIFAPVGGISIEKPDGWHLIPPDESLTNLKGFDFENPEVQRSVAAPLITLTSRLPSGGGGIIPTIKVNYVAYPQIGERGPMGAIADVIEVLRGASAEFELLKQPYAATIAGRPAARALVAFSVRYGDQVLKGETEMVVIQRGNLGMYTLGYMYNAGEGGETRPAFDMAFASLRIDPK